MKKSVGDTASKPKAAANDIGPITGWDSFFGACGRARPHLERYEGCVRSWFSLMGDPSEADSRHESGFWKSYRAFSKPVIIGIAKVAGIVAGIVLVLVVLLSALTSFLDLGAFGLAVLADAYGAGIFAATTWTRAFTIALILGLVSAAVAVGAHMLRKTLLEREMATCEETLRDYVSYMPPKYRNAFCADAFYEMWTAYGVGDINQAIDVCDEHIANNRGRYRAIQLMSDVPYVGAGSSKVHFAERERSWDEPDDSNPDLPDDISSHLSEGVPDAEEALNSLIGLENVKKQVRTMRNRIDFYGDESKRLSGNHMIFMGSAGTGKSSVARIITRILYDYGYIHANRIVEIDGDYLKSTYVGGTGKRTQAIVDYAAGGVLFIDEAYLLFDAKASGSAGTEATGVLLKAMEDMRDDIVVIMAGYEDPMTRLIASNEGFASRIRHRFYFEDYTTDELMQIFDLFLSKSSGNHTYEVDDHARELVRGYFDAERGRAGFGGARAVRNAVDAIMDIHADNFISGDGAELDRWRITAADGERFAEQMRELAGADSRNMMAAMHIDESIISASELKQHTHEAPADVTSELASLVGLESAKAELEALRAQSEFWAGKGVAMGHMAFLGAPGTAKSTMAGIVTACLHDMGYIRDRRYVDVNGDFFRGAYVGHTGKRTSATIEYATGGVLFIDEAYLLSPTGTQDTFGAEALGVLVDAMEKKRGQLVVILAGYTEDMERLFSVNVGLRSRISTILHFESYSLKELCQIFAVMARAQDFACDDALYGPLSRHLRVAMADPQFGNGRYVRELLGDVIKEHIMRVSRGETSERMLLDSADVEAAVAKRE